MKTTNIRELRHSTAAVLQWIQQGHAVEITRRHRVVALMTPPPAINHQRVRPDFAARMKQIWGDKVQRTTWTDLIKQERGDR
jgi:antitoxin (DNA-binding transcriptional repressor) of toxin-antitoxin stability system